MNRRDAIATAAATAAGGVAVALPRRVAADEQKPTTATPMMGAEPTYQAYWLRSVENPASSYQTLLLTTAPLETLANSQLGMLISPASPLVFDHPALRFSTVGRHSLWEQPFRCVEKVGAVDAKQSTVELDGERHTYEACPIADVVRLLENPADPKHPVHRRIAPLQGAERTARIMIGLLKAQLAAKK